VCVEDWIADGYRFRQNGTSKLPRNNPQVKKIHYQLQLPDGKRGPFKKFVYEVIGQQDYLILHYVGNETEAADFPHGMYWLRKKLASNK